MAKGRLRMGIWSALLAAACDSVTAPPLAVCNPTYQPLALQVAQYRAIDPTLTQGCVVFPVNANTDSAEYLLVPQATTETPDLTATFKLAGGALAMATAQLAAVVQSYPPSPAEQFHNMLRELERTRAYASLAPGAAPARSQTASPPGVDTVGNQRTFTVLRNLTNGSTGTPVAATAQSVGQHIALYVDNAAPAGGLTTTDLDAMRDAFDQNLYPADTAAFGRESDIDGNGLVIVLMTNLVNKYVTASDCQATGYVAGFFFGGDIDPTSAHLFNNGEIFYTIVADPAGTLSCVHSTPVVKRVVAGTLVHEFQHMISYNHHVLLQPPASRRAEVLWLNEALSHYAEELGGRTLLPDTVSFCNYVSGDLSNAALYLTTPGSYPLVDTAGIGGLANRGEGWMFVRYLVDRFAQDTTLAAQNAVTRALDQTSTPNVTGTANVAQVTGAPFATTVGEWALANWASDLPGFTAPTALKYKKWAFRTAYPALRAKCGATIPPSFPLVATADAGRSINLSGTIVSGSGAAYQRALQAPGAAGFTILFSDGTGAQLKTTVVPRLNVLRIR